MSIVYTYKDIHIMYIYLCPPTSNYYLYYNSEVCVWLRACVCACLSVCAGLFENG